MAVIVPRFSGFSAGLLPFPPWQADGRWARLNQALLCRRPHLPASRAQAWPCSTPNPSSAANGACRLKASTGTRKSKAVNANYWSTPAACCWPPTLGQPTKMTERATKQPRKTWPNWALSGCTSCWPTLATAANPWPSGPGRTAAGNGTRANGQRRLYARANPVGGGALH